MEDLLLLNGASGDVLSCSFKIKCCCQLHVIAPTEPVENSQASTAFQMQTSVSVINDETFV